jgi:hypothetical protein
MMKGKYQAKPLPPQRDANVGIGPPAALKASRKPIKLRPGRSGARPLGERQTSPDMSLTMAQGQWPKE